MMLSFFYLQGILDRPARKPHLLPLLSFSCRVFPTLELVSAIDRSLSEGQLFIPITIISARNMVTIRLSCAGTKAARIESCSEDFGGNDGVGKTFQLESENACWGVVVEGFSVARSQSELEEH
jgi:hypothetical protein